LGLTFSVHGNSRSNRRLPCMVACVPMAGLRLPANLSPIPDLRTSVLHKTLSPWRASHQRISALLGTTSPSTLHSSLPYTCWRYGSFPPKTSPRDDPRKRAGGTKVSPDNSARCCRRPRRHPFPPIKAGPPSFFAGRSKDFWMNFLGTGEALGDLVNPFRLFFHLDTREYPFILR